MAYTAGSIVSDVQERLSNTSKSSSQIRQYINDTQRALAADGYYRFFKTSQSYTLTQDNNDITSGNGLPSDFQMPKLFRLTSSGYEKVLTPVKYDEFVEKYPSFENDDSALPSKWYMDGDNAYVYPAPDSAYTSKLEYFKTPTEITADSDVPEFPVDFREVLVLGALARAYKDDDDYDQADEVEDDMVALLINLKRRYSSTPAVKYMSINRSRVDQK